MCQLLDESGGLECLVVQVVLIRVDYLCDGLESNQPLCFLFEKDHERSSFNKLIMNYFFFPSVVHLNFNESSSCTDL